MRVREKQDKVQVEEAKVPAPQYLVRILDANEWPAWDAFVSKSPQGTLFHTTKWLQTTGEAFKIYGCFKDDCLIGGMVVEVVDHRIAGHSHHSPYLGVVLPPSFPKYLTTLTYHKNILIALANYVKEQFQAISSRMGPDVRDVQPFIWAGYSISVRYTYRIDLRDLDAAWLNMEDKRRNDIRKAERDGITIDHEGSMKDILSLVETTFQRQRQRVDFGELAMRREKVLSANNQCRCFVAKSSAGEPIAGVFMVWDEKCAYYLLGGYHPESSHRGAGALAIWNAIRYAGEALELQQFDFVGSTVRPVERFFRDFGGFLIPTYVVNFQHPSLSRDLRRVLQRVRRGLKPK
jgi:hypothetical protein